MRVPSTRFFILAKAISRRSGGVVGERRKSAIVGRSERFERNQLGRFEHAIAHFLRTLHPGIDRVRDANEEHLIRARAVLAIALQDPSAVRFAGQLNVEAAQPSNGTEHGSNPE